MTLPHDFIECPDVLISFTVVFSMPGSIATVDKIRCSVCELNL